MSIRNVTKDKLTWVDIDKPDAAAIAFLKENYNFHHLDFEDIQGESQTPKIDTYKNYLFLILQFPKWDSKKQRVTTHDLHMFIGTNFLVTIHQTPNAEIKKFFNSRMKSKRIQKQWMSSSAGFLLYKIIEAQFKNMRPVLNDIGKQLSELEEEIFSAEQDVNTVKELAIHRRNILHFRRVIDPQRYLVANLSHIRKTFLNEETSLYFDDIHDYLNKVWAILDSYRETIHGLHVTVESLINQRTNKIVSTLTAISVGLLPFTVLSGIYGMNITSLPFANNPIGVWMMFVALALIVGILLTIMRRKTWL